MSDEDGVDTHRLYSTTNAVVWAEQFVKVHPEANLDDMIGWFANAIENAKDHATRKFHQRTIQVHYSLPASGCAGGRDGAERARQKMLNIWAPTHWHLDSVGSSDKYVTSTFSIIPEDSELWNG